MGQIKLIQSDGRRGFSMNKAQAHELRLLNNEKNKANATGLYFVCNNNITELKLYNHYPSDINKDTPIAVVQNTDYGNGDFTSPAS